MKKTLVYIIISSMLLSQTELHELLKVPALFVHYSEHLIEHPGLSFMQFLHEHYAGNHENSTHEEGLPFNDNHCSLCSFTCAVIPSIEYFSFSKSQAPKTFHYGYVKEFISQSFSEIWQPPKLQL